jgi:leucyl-tRNA synthetase
VQVNGRIRFTILVPAGSGSGEIEQILAADENYAAHTAGAEVDRLVIVPGRIVSVVVR